MRVARDLGQGKNSSPSLQLIHGREFLETHYSEISKLQQDLYKSIAHDLEEVIDVASSFDELTTQAMALIKLLEVKDSRLFPIKSQIHLYGLKRIVELSTSSSSQLEEMAAHLCRGKPIRKQMNQLERNLFPLKQLLGDTVSWLNLLIDGSRGTRSISS